MFRGFVHVCVHVLVNLVLTQRGQEMPDCHLSGLLKTAVTQNDHHGDAEVEQS